MNNDSKVRTTIFYKNYFREFFVKHQVNVKAKIIWTLDLIEEVQRIPETYLKHIESTDGLYEIRVQLGSGIFRIFCFLIKENLSFWLADFKKKHNKHNKKKSTKHLK